MASTFTKILLHITFSTRHRADIIAPACEERLYGYIGGICRRFESPLLSIGGTENHVHLFVSQSKNVALSNLLMELKRDSSKVMKECAPDFAWQDGYFAFSIGESASEDLLRYISRQKEHHRTESFQDEMRRILAKYNMTWDEDYIWT